MPHDSSSTDPHATEDETRAGVVMLALSTFRHSEHAVALALDKAAEGGELVIAYIADINVARYLVGTDVGLYPDLKEETEKALLEESERRVQSKIESIAQRAAERGVPVRTYARIGRFAPECMEIIEQEQPDLVVTTRSQRSDWFRRFLGSPVDRLRQRAGRPVIEA